MKTILLTGMLLLVINLTAQKNYLAVGDTLPVFSSKITNYKKASFTNADLKNRLTILDLWGTTCGACIAGMPKMKKLQDRYGDALQVILVTENSAAQVNALATKNKLVRENKLPSIIGDSQMYRRFNFQSIPTHIWIDSAGRVIYITDGWDTNDSTITAWLQGKDPKIIQKLENRHFDYKTIVHFLENNNPYAPLLQQYSFFMGRIDGCRNNFIIETDSITGDLVRLTIVNEFPLNLFRHAFKTLFQITGDNRRLILAGKTALALVEPKELEQKTGWRNGNMFTYQLKPPANKRKDALLFMQQDLIRFFGVKATIEKREMPCLALIKLPGWKNKLSREKDTVCGYGNGRLVVSNCSINKLIYLLNDATSNKMNVPVFYDETSIKDNINIELNIAPLLDGNTEDLKKQLQKFGLTLIQKQEWIDMFVISDK